MKKATVPTMSLKVTNNIYPMALALFCLSVSSTAFAQLITIDEPARNSQNGNTQNQDLLEEEVLDETLPSNQEGMPQTQGQPVQVSAQALRTQPRLQANTQVSTQPVGVSAGMAPQAATQVPQGYAIQSSAPTYTDPNAGMAVSGASTGVGGNNPGNANTGGVQVQNVHVTATQEQKAENSSDLLKKVRGMKEGETNQIALDKIEEERLEREFMLRGKVNDLFQNGSLNDQNAQNQMPVQGYQNNYQAMPVQMAPTTIPVAPVGSSLEESVDLEPAKSKKSDLGASLDLKSNSFKVVPMGGYRWFENDNAEYEAQNMGLGGVGLEGALTKNISIEGSFLYGRDEFNYRGAMAYNSYANTGYYANGYYNNGYNSYNVNPLLAPRSRDSFEVNGALKLGADMGSVRPYVLGGIGGIMQKYNIDDSYTTEYLAQIGLSRSTNNVVGNFGAGMDFGSQSSSLRVGARFDYQSFFAGDYTEMQRIFGDISNRYRVIGSVQMVF